MGERKLVVDLPTRRNNAYIGNEYLLNAMLNCGIFLHRKESRRIYEWMYQLYVDCVVLWYLEINVGWLLCYAALQRLLYDDYNITKCINKYMIV